MTAGAIATHRAFHLGDTEGGFTCRPDVCDVCLGAWTAATRKAGRQPARLGAHLPNEGQPPTYADVLRISGAPLPVSSAPELFDPAFRDAMERHGYRR